MVDWSGHIHRDAVHIFFFLIHTSSAVVVIVVVVLTLKLALSTLLMDVQHIHISIVRIYYTDFSYSSYTERYKFRGHKDAFHKCVGAFHKCIYSRHIALYDPNIS